MKIYIEIDSIYGSIEFNGNSDVWHLSSNYDFEKLLNTILTPAQYKNSIDNDFCGHISAKRYKAAKTYYESLNKSK